MKCSAVQTRLPFYAVGETSATESPQLQHHLRHCARCRSELQKYQQCLRALKRWPNVEAEPPEWLLLAEASAATEKEKLTRWQRTQKVIDMLLRVAAILFLIALISGKLQITTQAGKNDQILLTLQEQIQQNHQNLLQLQLQHQALIQSWQSWAELHQKQVQVLLSEMNRLHYSLQQQRQQDQELLARFLQYVQAENQYAAQQTLHWIQKILQEKTK